jgi:hypothetical protein
MHDFIGDALRIKFRCRVDSLLSEHPEQCIRAVVDLFHHGIRVLACSKPANEDA